MEILHGKQCLDCFFQSVLQVLSKEMYPMQQWSENLFEKDAIKNFCSNIAFICCVDKMCSKHPQCCK